MFSSPRLENRSRPYRLTAVTGLAALVLAGCHSGSDGAADPASDVKASADVIPSKILIGSTLPLTGDESPNGQRIKRGYQLAIDQENADGGVELGGRKVPVELKLLDDATNKDKAVDLAKRLIVQDKVNFFLGTYSTDLVTVQSTEAELRSVPYVNAGGAASSIYSRAYQYVFGVLAPVSNLAGTEMQWIDDQVRGGSLPTPLKVAVVWENTSHGFDFNQGMRDFVGQRRSEYQIVENSDFQLNQTDYKDILKQVRDSQADVLMVDAHLPDFVKMQKQLLAADMCLKVVTYGARGSEPAAREELKQDGVNYILSGVWWNNGLGNKGISKDFVTKFKAKYHSDPQWYEAVGYEAARALLVAIAKAGSANRKKVRDTLATMTMDSLVPGGKLSFPPENGNQADYPFVIQQNLPNGTSPIIYPADVATGNGIASNPTCKKD